MNKPETPMNMSELMLMQKNLNARMGDPMGSGEVAIRRNALALIKEVTEVLDEINWKWWKAPEEAKVVDTEKLKSELVDVLQFWTNMVNAAGFSGMDMSDAYYAKLVVCQKRITEGSTTQGWD